MPCRRSHKHLLPFALLALGAAACTKPVTGYFAPLRQSLETAPQPVAVQESFAFSSTVSRTVSRYRDVDLLWMIDNSGSMSSYQQRISNGFKDFAKSYFVKERNIRLATITSDVFLAGSFTGTEKDYGPGNGRCFSFLLPGVHDGPRPDVASLNSDCSLNGALPAGRTGKPILASQNSNGTTVDLAALAADFHVNAMVGTRGNGSERGFQSTLKLLEDNEGKAECATGGEGCLFRKDKLRALIYLSDEHSQDVLGDGATTIEHRAADFSRKTDAEVIAESRLLADHFRGRLNQFFTGLDGAGKTDPNYFVVTLANKTCVEIGGDYCGLRENNNNVLVRDSNERWGPEYDALVESVKADTTNSAGAFSISASIADSVYGTVLNQVGQILDNQTEDVIVTSFTLSRDPSPAAPIKAFVVDGGVSTQIPMGAVHVKGRVVDIDQSSLPASGASSTAQIVISYVPI